MSEAEQKDSKSKRHNMRMYDADYNALVYWADAFGMDRTEFLINAMHHYIKYKNQDYPIPAAEIQRLNQMVDAVGNLAARQASLEKTIVSGFDAMLGIIRGGNYLVDEEDGIL